MLDFFRRYQKIFFIVAAILIISSFSFFGVSSTFSDTQAPREKRTGPFLETALDGSALASFEVENLSRLIATDQHDLGWIDTLKYLPNLCNDGVIRLDLLSTSIAQPLVQIYFEELQSDLAERFDRVKRYRPYVSSQNPAISARGVWEQFSPSLVQNLDALQKEEKVSEKTFAYLAHLYEAQSHVPPEFVRRVLVYQRGQNSLGGADPFLQQGDLSLFGFHILADWFGQRFIDLCSQFILHGAKEAELKGYRVSSEEAKAHLLKNFRTSLAKLAELKRPLNLQWTEHLRMLGLDEKSAVEGWRKVLLFRRYFDGVGDGVFVDRLAHKQFADFASEKAKIEEYKWPAALTLKTIGDLAAFQTYLQAVCPNTSSLALPTSYLSLDEVEKKAPELIQSAFQANWAQISKSQVALKASIQEVFDWELEENNWEKLRKEFPDLPKGSDRQEKFRYLEKLSLDRKTEMDRYARNALLELHPEWLAEALQEAQGDEITIRTCKGWSSLAGIENPAKLSHLLEKATQKDPEAIRLLSQYSDDGNLIHRFQGVEKKGTPRILTWAEARKEGHAERLADRLLADEYLKIRTRFPEKFQLQEGKWRPFSSVKEEVAKIVFQNVLQSIGGEVGSRFKTVSQEAFTALQQNRNDPRWIRSRTEDLAEQFKLERNTQEIERTAQDGWMKQQVFTMTPRQWSPIHYSSSDPICFFYFDEKKSIPEPIFDRLMMSQERLSADAKRCVAKEMLERLKKRKSMIIPLQVDRK